MMRMTGGQQNTFVIWHYKQHTTHKDIPVLLSVFFCFSLISSVYKNTYKDWITVLFVYSINLHNIICIVRTYIQTYKYLFSTTYIQDECFTKKGNICFYFGWSGKK